MMRLFRVLGLVGIVGAGSAVPASGSSILVTGGTTFTVDWLNTQTAPDLSGFGTFTITDWSSSGFSLAISNITDTTPNLPDINSRLTSFGFGLTPNATGFINTVDGDVFRGAFPIFQVSIRWTSASTPGKAIAD
jgi:hypothetical protein